tara:strand:- start:25 stop:222 length:198 start_codon:yes stop_codon:yes gene_type:complete
MSTAKSQLYQWLDNLPMRNLNVVLRLAHKIKTRKIKAKQAAYSAQENSWFNHETDKFPAPLNDQN